MKSYICEKTKKWAELCEHVRAALKMLEAAGLEIGGCGCCGSPFITCQTCGSDESNIDEAYQNHYDLMEDPDRETRADRRHRNADAPFIIDRGAPLTLPKRQFITENPKEHPE